MSDSIIYVLHHLTHKFNLSYMMLKLIFTAALFHLMGILLVIHTCFPKIHHIFKHFNFHPWKTLAPPLQLYDDWHSNGRLKKVSIGIEISCCIWAHHQSSYLGSSVKSIWHLTALLSMSWLDEWIFCSFPCAFFFYNEAKKQFNF